MAEYTHEISWREYHQWFDIFVAKSFRTTSDMVETHIAALKAREYDSDGNQNITRLRVERLS